MCSGSCYIDTNSYISQYGPVNYTSDLYTAITIDGTIRIGTGGPAASDVIFSNYHCPLPSGATFRFAEIQYFNTGSYTIQLAVVHAGQTSTTTSNVVLQGPGCVNLASYLSGVSQLQSLQLMNPSLGYNFKYINI
jgi:hypothetical protein